MTRIKITAAGHSFIAETNPDAPLTVAAFIKLLPYTQKLIHVRWSGEGVWVPLGEFQLGVGFENHTSHPSVGDILFYPGGYSEQDGATCRQPLPDHRRRPRKPACAGHHSAVAGRARRAVRSDLISLLFNLNLSQESPI
jgi:Protein of unknown function (DUF3830)